MGIKTRFQQYMKKKNESPMNNRKKVGIILFATSIGLFFLFAVRLSYIVIGGTVSDVSLEEKTTQLYEGERVVKARRGTIYDRNGEIIATDAVSYSAHVVLSTNYYDGTKRLYAEEADFATLAEILSNNLDLSKDYAMKQMKAGLANNSWQVEFGSQGKDISIEVKKKIEAEMKEANVVGIEFDEKSTRMYPNGTLASHLIGYATMDENGNMGGVMGLEAAYDDILAGKDGKIVYKKDNFQNPLPGTVDTEVKAENGKDIYTTIDIKVQNRLDDALASAYENSEPENMTGILVEAKTGNIVAMSQAPSFNPETKEGLGENDIWQNLLVEDSFEPGSTMKSMTVAAAIEEGVFNENESYTAYNGYTIADTRIDDHDFGEKGPLTMRQALTWSSNVGMLILESRMQEPWQEYLKKFGFGQNTYSGLPEETPGLLPDDNIVSQAMSSFGQAVAVTDLQMMKAYIALANNGVMLQPQYLSKIVDTDTGATNYVQPVITGNPIKASTAATIREYLRGTVEDDYGIAKDLFGVEGYNISVKTGTAEIAKPDGAGYYTNNYLYSMVEMVPAEDPEYILYLKIKLPTSYSSKVLAEVANTLMQFVMDSPDAEETMQEPQEDAQVVVADYINQDRGAAGMAARRQLLSPVMVGDGSKVINQSIVADTKVPTSSRLILLMDGDVVMPDVYGWSKEEVAALASMLDIKINLQGEGYAVSQSLSSYQKIGDEAITVEFE